MNTLAIKFCLSCGAPRHGNAAFCGACGNLFPVGDAPASLAVPTNENKGAWRVIAGTALPEASQLFNLTQRSSATVAIPKSAPVMPPASKGKPLWGSALWMSLTQAADMVTQTVGTGVPTDQYLSLRMGVAAAVAVFSLALAPLPRLRCILVRLGTLSMAVLQGQGLVPVIQSAVLDPPLIGALAPNLAAQAAGMMALLQLFVKARARRP